METKPFFCIGNFIDTFRGWAMITTGRKKNGMERWNAVWKNISITAGILAAASGFTLLLNSFVDSDSHVPLLFVLAILFISRFTEGYIYGIVAAIAAVIEVNYIFTYPYFEFNFTITGYPLTFVAMLAVSLSVSALTTQIKQQEQIRLEVEKEKMRANLMRAVSHDIRTPLTSIMGSASGIIENHKVLSEEKQLELLYDIREEAQWLIRIVENLLSVTRMSGENTKLNTEEEVAEEVISSAVMKFRKRFPDEKVEVKMPEEMLLVSMDGVLIEQVLVNLLENSVLHGKTVSLIQIIVTHEPGKMIVSVEDDGQGIKESVLPVMFEGKLSSADGEEYDSKRNMGIGLSVCKSIVSAHKGEMKAENRKEGGARVMFWLPMEDEVDGY